MWALEKDTIETIPQPADQVLFSHDGQRLAVAYEGHVEIWTVQSPHRLHTLGLDYGPREWLIGIPVMFAALSPDDGSLSVATHHHVHVWSVGDSKPRCRFGRPYRGYEPRISLELSPDANFVPAALYQHIWVWHLDQPVKSQPLHVEFSHKAKTCRLDTNSTRVLVDEGASVLPPGIVSLAKVGRKEERKQSTVATALARTVCGS